MEYNNKTSPEVYHKLRVGRTIPKVARENIVPSTGSFSKILEQRIFSSPKSPGCSVWKYAPEDTFWWSLQGLRGVVMNWFKFSSRMSLFFNVTDIYINENKD